MAEQKYYGVVGTNGYGVYTDYAKVKKACEYLRKSRVKGHKCFNDAREWVVEMCDEMQSDIGDSSYEPIKKMNWTYYKKKCV